MLKKIFGFTLSEVLVTLAIIGVVAALTIPTLMYKINNKLSESRTKTIEARLLDGFNRLNTLDDGFNASQYENTKQFVEALSKYYKMSAICDSDEITRCLPYENVTWVEYDNEGNETESGSVEVSTLTSIDKLRAGETEDWLAPASFISAQGTPVVISLNKKCIMDTGKAMREFPSNCIALLYDQNGTNIPNRVGKDIVTKGLDIIKPNGEVATEFIVGGVKIKTTAEVPTPLTYAQCIEEKNKNYGITKCFDFDADGGDRWAGAMKMCHDQGLRLPTGDELAAIANDLYNTTAFSKTTNKSSGLTFDSSKVSTENHPLSGLSYDWTNFWSSEEYNNENAYLRDFYTSYSYWWYYTRGGDESCRAVCVE